MQIAWDGAYIVGLSVLQWENDLANELASEVSLQCVIPDADLALDGWTDHLGASSNIYQAIDEEFRDDSDFIRSANSPSDDEYICSLSDFGSDPAEPFEVNYSYGAVIPSGSPTMSLIVTLYEGATAIASKTHASVAAGLFQDKITLSSGEFASIGDFTDLRLGFKANQS